MFIQRTLAIAALLAYTSMALENCLPPTIHLGLQNCTFSVANQTEVESWGVLLGVGRSEQLCGMVSTVVNSSMLQSSEVCSEDWLSIGNFTMTPAQCRSRRGGFVMRNNLPEASTDGLAELNPGWTTFMAVDDITPFQFAAKPALQLRDESVTMLTGLITQGQQHTTSHIGLAEESTLLRSLKDSGLIAATSWGLNAGSQSYLFPRDGSLVLGGFDESSVDGPFFTYNITKPNMLNNRPCPFQIEVTGMTLEVSSGDGSDPVSRSFYSKANSLRVCIEPYDNLFRLPSPDLQDVLAMFSQVGTNDTGTVQPSQYADLYNLEPGLVYPRSAGNFSVSMEITINDGQTVTIPSYELVRPLRGLDADGRQIVDTRFNEVQIYSQPAPEDGPVFGKAFLSQLYLFVDFESSNFRLAKQNLEANTPLPKSSAECPDKEKLTKTDKGLIAIGSVLAAAVVAGLIYLLYRWLKKEPVGKVSDPATGNGPIQLGELSETQADTRRAPLDPVVDRDI